MTQLSVIIPIYNTPRSALMGCFASLSSLSRVDYEVVLIDDGSEEPTGTFCREYCAQHSGFHYHRKENGGVSSARNYGIAVAKGKYLMFADADDEVLGEPITRELLEGNDSLIIFDMMIRCGEQERHHHGFEMKEAMVDRESLLHRLITSKALNSPCDKLFLREILIKNKLVFPEDFVTGEDWMFVAAFAQQAETLVYVPRPCYRYLMDQGTGRARVLRHPDKILDNQLTRFATKNKLLEEENWCRYDRVTMLSEASVELIENLFNTAADLLMGKAFVGQRREKLLQAAASAGKNLQSDAPSKTKMKLWVLTRMPILLRPLAGMRAIYLKKR